MHRFTLRFRRKRNVSHTYSPKTHNFASSLNTLYTAKSAQFDSAFSPTTISLTPCIRQKREVWLRFFAENAQNDPKTHSCKDSAKFNSAFSAMPSRFQRKWREIKNFEYLGEFEEYFRKCWLYCVLYKLVTERCKKKFKNRLWKSHACVPLIGYLRYCNRCSLCFLSSSLF